MQPVTDELALRRQRTTLRRQQECAKSSVGHVFPDPTASTLVCERCGMEIFVKKAGTD